MDGIDRLLTPRDLASYFGVPVTTLYAWRYQRLGPPGFRVGKHLRYRQADVEAWIESQLEEAGGWAAVGTSRCGAAGRPPALGKGADRGAHSTPW